MPWLRIATLLLGLGLFGWVLWNTDLEQVGTAMAQIGLLGALAVAAVYFAAFLVDTQSWQLAVPSAPLGPTWFYRLWKVRMVGEAFNVTLPSTMGGEPVKAVLLKRHFGIGYKESGASLVIAKTVNLWTVLPYAGVGLIAMGVDGVLPEATRTAAWIGLGALALGTAGFFAVQRWRVASRLAHLLVARWRHARRLEAILDQIDAVESYFHDFYAERPGRFAGALGLAFTNWCLGMFEIWVVMNFLGTPIALHEALMISTMLELVRAGTFFIPASLGAAEVTYVLMAEALTGQGALGLAVALVRRARELVWIAWGLCLGWALSVTPAPAAAPPPPSTTSSPSPSTASPSGPSPSGRDAAASAKSCEPERS